MLVRKRARQVTEACTTGDTSRVGSEQGPPLLEFPAQRKGNRPPRAGVEDRSAQRGGKGGVLRGKRSGVGVLKFAARVYPAKSSIARVQEALRASFISPLQVFLLLFVCVCVCVSVSLYDVM